MKKLYTLTALCFATTAINAQTIQGTDFNGTIGEVYDYVVGNYMSPGTSGAGQTWDFSSIMTSATSNTTGAAANAAFPASNITQVDQTGGEIYWEYSNTDQIIHGITSGGVLISYSNPMSMLSFPLSMSTSGSDTHLATFTSGGFPFTRGGSTTWEVDGSGTVITPNGTYTDVLRVHQTQTYTDTYSGGTIDYDVDIYQWIKPGIHAALASQTSFVTSFSSDQYSTYYVGSVGLGENEAVSFELYPNPSQDFVKISVNDASVASVLLTDLSGKVVSETIWDGGSEASLDLTELLSGIYLATLVMDDGSQSAAQRIVRL